MLRNGRESGCIVPCANAMSKSVGLLDEKLAACRVGFGWDPINIRQYVHKRGMQLATPFDWLLVGRNASPRSLVCKDLLRCVWMDAELWLPTDR
jgi:hypothetical protein